MKTIKAPFRNLAGDRAWDVGEAKRNSTGPVGTGTAEIRTQQGGSSPFVSAVEEPFDIILKLFSFLL